MSTTRHMRGKLINRDGTGCHYCNTDLGRSDSTIDHVVPRCMGGISHPDNYVLACGDCNSTRGNDLYWCDCAWCGPVIEHFKDTQSYFDYVFYKLIKYNHPRVIRTGSRWKVFVHNNTHSFPNWDDALHFALTYGKEPK